MPISEALAQRMNSFPNPEMQARVLQLNISKLMHAFSYGSYHTNGALFSTKYVSETDLCVNIKINI